VALQKVTPLHLNRSTMHLTVQCSSNSTTQQRHRPAPSSLGNATRARSEEEAQRSDD
jgi:murein endopeptidase